MSSAATHRILLNGQPVGLARVNAAGVVVRLHAGAPGMAEWAEHVLACGVEFDELVVNRGGRWAITKNPVTGWNRPVPGAQCARDDRPNPDLEAIFAEPLPEPVRPAENLRHNPDLDAVFGV